MSHIDHILDTAKGLFFDHDIEQARAEVEALRQRVADLELIAHYLAQSETPLLDVIAWDTFGKPMRWIDWKSDMEFDDDGTGLPPLTPEARKALERMT